MKNTVARQVLTGERALFASEDLTVENCVFEDGESPLKESRALTIRDSVFRWKYPLWYCADVTAERTVLEVNARAGIWYTKNLRMRDALIAAPKTFRRCDGLALENVQLTSAAETLWSCRNVTMTDVSVKGDYFAMNCENVTAAGLRLDGNYSFDGAKNVKLCDSVLLSKDAFWNSENVTVENCLITGEYLGWNAKDLTLKNCTIESLQGLCYIGNLRMENCRLINTTLAFEYSDVHAVLDGGVDSVLNPKSGYIEADSIGLLTVEPDRVDPAATKIVLRKDA